MIRRLGPADAAAYREIRLEALLDAPEAYGSVHADWADAPMSVFEARTEASVVLGGFVDGTLAGLAVMDREKGGNARHRAHVTAAYVRPVARGHGLMARMLDWLAADARAAGVLQLELHVAVTNAAAIRAYERAGFVRAGIALRSILSRERFIDEMLMVRRLDASGGDN